MWLADADVATGRLVPVLPRHPRITGQLYMVHPQAKHVPVKVTAFRDLLVEVLRGRTEPSG